MEIPDNIIDLAERTISNYKDRFRFYAFFYFLFNRQIYLKNKDASLSTNCMKRIYGKASKSDKRHWRYKKYLDILTEDNILTKVKNYSTNNGTCNHYLLDLNLLLSNCKKNIGIRPSKDKAFWKRYMEGRKLNCFEAKISNHINNHIEFDPVNALYTYLESEYPDISKEVRLGNPFVNVFEKAYELGKAYIQKKHRMAIKYSELRKRPKRLSSIEKSYFDELGRFIYYINTCRSYSSAKYRVKQDVFGKRIHTYYTNLPKQLRTCITTSDGATLIEVDCVNSQPHLIANLLQKDGYWVDSSFIEDVRSGKLYDLLASDLGISRSESKNQCFKNMFFAKRNTVRFNARIGKVIKRRYPNTFNSICKYVIGDSKKLCREAQRLESDIFIRDVYTRLINEGIPSLTIHDSILVEEKYVELVQNYLNEAYINRGLHVPTFKTGV